MICKKTLPPSSLRQWPPILPRCALSWIDHNHRFTPLIYHVIPLYLQKGASPVSQRQWPLNLIRLWVRVKGSYLLFQVTCWPSDHVLFEKHQVSIKARSQNSAGVIKQRKTQIALCEHVHDNGTQIVRLKV